MLYIVMFRENEEKIDMAVPHCTQPTQYAQREVCEQRGYTIERIIR